MRIAIGSAFRDSQTNAYAYIERISGLQERVVRRGDELRVIAGEGDSVDATRSYLSTAARVRGVALEFADCAHGGPRYGSTEDPARMRALSHVLNRIMDAVRLEDDIFVYVEQDLAWEPKTLESLIYRVAHKLDHYDVLAPMVMAGQLFYDVWGFRGVDENRWYGVFPYHREVDHDALTCQVSSVGSCCAMRAEVALVTRVRNDNAFVGWCLDARQNGFKLGACPDLFVRQA